jgi:Fungal Zn(2)-Cys(6) binuclear cluster domain
MIIFAMTSKKVTYACDHCKKYHFKCNVTVPCKTCVKHGLQLECQRTPVSKTTGTKRKYNKLVLNDKPMKIFYAEQKAMINDWQISDFGLGQIKPTKKYTQESMTIKWNVDGYIPGFKNISTVEENLSYEESLSDSTGTVPVKSLLNDTEEKCKENFHWNCD